MLNQPGRSEKKPKFQISQSVYKYLLSAIGTVKWDSLETIIYLLSHYSASVSICKHLSNKCFKSTEHILKIMQNLKRYKHQLMEFTLKEDIFYNVL